jgi:FtsH-binding integral membrane protein
MAFQPNFTGRTFVADTRTFDEGLRRHMIGVYNYMMLGLVLTGLVAYFAAHTPAAVAMLQTMPIRLGVMLAPFLFIMVLGFGIRNLSQTSAQLLFYAFSATMGLSLSTIFLVYTQQSISLVFFITASMFGATSLYGYTTKRNLAGMGSFLFMGLIGLIIAGFANMFMHSSAMQMMISFASVIVFTGYTAFHTQQIRDAYSAGYGVQSNAKLAIIGALSLYLDFINLFMAMLRLLGNRR